MTFKKLRDLDMASVLAEPRRPGANDEFVFIQRDPMLDERVLGKMRSLAEFGDGRRRHPVFEPSPLARMMHEK